MSVNRLQNTLGYLRNLLLLFLYRLIVYSYRFVFWPEIYYTDGNKNKTYDIFLKTERGGGGKKTSTTRGLTPTTFRIKYCKICIVNIRPYPRSCVPVENYYTARGTASYKRIRNQQAPDCAKPLCVLRRLKTSSERIDKNEKLRGPRTRIN